jgi:hypothetical protein
MLSLRDELRRRETADAMELVRLRRVVEERDAQNQKLQGVREALEEANMRVGLCVRADSKQSLSLSQGAGCSGPDCLTGFGGRRAKGGEESEGGGGERRGLEGEMAKGGAE